MATRVSIISICDGCGYEGAQGSTYPVLITAPNPDTLNVTEYELDLCMGCIANKLTQLLNAGRPVKRTYAKGKKPVSPTAPDGSVDLNCGYPGCGYVGPRLQSLNAHRTKAGHWDKMTKTKAKR